MIRNLWRRLHSLLPTRSRLSVGLLAVESLLAGLLEAALLVLVVAVALSVAEAEAAVDLSFPLIGQIGVAPRLALVVAGAAGLVVVALHLHAARLTARLAGEVLRAARDRAITAFANAPWSRQAEEKEGALQETVGTHATQSSALITHLSNLMASLLGLCALLSAAMFVDPLVTVVVLLFGAMVFACLRPIARITRRRAREYVTANSAFTEQMSEWSALALDLRVFGVDGAEARRLAAENSTTARALTRTRFAGRAGSDLYRDLAILFLVGAAAGIYLTSGVELAAVGAVLLLIMRSLTYAQTSNAVLQSISEVSPNLDLFIARVEALEATIEPVGRQVVDNVTLIQLQDVCYDYAVSRPGIEGVTLDVGAGEAVGVIGPSGAGKSTLVQVLLRLRLPTRGTITVSGVAYQEIEPACWHRLVALVPQEPKLFQGTVASNIAFLRPDISREQVERGAEDAHVIDDIRRLPQGFDTELGPRGTGLSSGQKQRVAIARALVGEPQLLVLDEPTSALDVRSEQLLQRTIEELNGRVTLLIVAHRLTTLACCDRVVAMEAGKVKVIGSLEEALSQVSFDHHLGRRSDLPASSLGGC